MNAMAVLGIITFIAGLVVGFGGGLLFAWKKFRVMREADIVAAADSEQRKTEETEKIISQMKESFQALSLEALSKNTEEFLKVAGESLGKHTEAGTKELGGKKDLIDQTLKTMKAELGKVNTMVRDLEKDRHVKFEVLSEQLNKAAKETHSLRETTHSLKAALTNSRVRGQWGERMAEDVLRLAGFVEGINYKKQGVTEEGNRPDYTFYLPQNRIVNMDVKFPLENYLAYLEAETGDEREKYRLQFLKDTRKRIDEVTKRNYVDTTQDTLDYVLVFIPNEQVYSFVNENDRELLDIALSKKIILCSPTTLYAVLAVIRQAVDNFHLERTASEILALLGQFNKQWGMFADAMDKVGKRIDDSQKAFHELSGTRLRMLEKPLREIESMQREYEVETKTGTPLKVIENLDVVGKEN